MMPFETLAESALQRSGYPDDIHRDVISMGPWVYELISAYSGPFFLIDQIFSK